MNICYLIDVSPERFKGGGQTHLTNLIREMNFQFSIFNFQLFGGPGANTFVRLLWCFWVTGQVVFFYFFKRRFDLIHAHSIPAMVSGKILSVILGIPVVVTVHGYNGKRRMEKLVLTKIKYDAQITVSRNFLEVKNINKNVVYIPNGIDIVKFTKLEVYKGLTLRTQGETLSNKTVLFVGRKNDPVKGFSILETALESVKKEIPQAKLLVAGGDLPGDEVLRLYQKADLFVLPSLSEGFPLTLLEAWASGLPVVATKVGELPYLIKDGVNGYLVDPGSADKLALVIIKALKNRNLAKLGENGYNLVKNYKWSKVARSTLKVYESVVL